MIRTFTLADLSKLENSALFPLNNIRGKEVLLNGSIEEKGKLVGSFLVTKTAELSLILSSKSSCRERLLALKELYNILPEELHHRRIDELHVFANDPKFSNLIVEHFGFSYCLGRSLVWRFQGR